MVDLIYANKNKEDIAILHEYSFDLAYGVDENNFELTVPLNPNDIEIGYFVYIDGTEYGGIIDKLGVNTRNNKIIYKGRTWHGILAGKILEPEEGCDYVLLSGDANEVIAEIIERCDLADIFVADTTISGIDIDNYQCRYADAYSALTDMLFQATGKLKITHVGTQTMLSAVPYVDYSQDEEWDASQRDFSAEIIGRPVNHLICLGSGQLEERYVIHLFADENGGIQAYTNSDVPIKDSDYILTKERQQLFGIDEVTKILDYPNAAETKNYVMLNEKPADFDTNYLSYYTINETGDAFNQVEAVKEDSYYLIGKEPLDWQSKYDNYYILEEDGKYRAVKKQEVKYYSLLTSVPRGWETEYGGYYYVGKDDDGNNEYCKVEGITKVEYVKCLAKVVKKDWKNNYSNYYYKKWDGTQYLYENVSGIRKNKYKVQSKKPSDWLTNYTSYYKKKIKESGYERLTEAEDKKAPKWKKKTYYTEYDYTVAPKYDARQTYYLKKSYEIAPEFENNKYYGVTVEMEVPEFAALTYYGKTEIDYPPEWVSEVYYELFIDHYAELVKKGLEQMQEYFNCDTIEIELNPINKYDIGDVVGARENITGLAVWQPITKKIVSITEKKITIDYKVGGNV